MKTRREKIIKLLSEHEDMTIKELADLTQSSVKIVVEDLNSVRKTIRSEKKRIEVRPATCINCNYVFPGRSRISDPHKCPECHSERIVPQKFRIST
ncbi:MAG: transcriptional regulator [Candidatus Hodarchaeales archaeon]|jgi:predicted Zn-ribbon and HTH transcriptional regulator